MAKASTNALTARLCATRGWPCETIQTWRGNKRHDAFGFADSLALVDGCAKLIQNASYGTLKAHRDAMNKNPLVPYASLCGLGIEIWEWRRPKLRRGSKNRSRMWQVRCQTYSREGNWSEVSDWSAPADLYPKKTK